MIPHPLEAPVSRLAAVTSEAVLFRQWPGHGGPADLDTDHDGLSDTLESALGTNPLLADSDHDGFTDPLEASYGGNPLGSSLGTAATAPASVDPADAGQHDAMHPGVDAGWH